MIDSIVTALPFEMTGHGAAIHAGPFSGFRDRKEDSAGLYADDGGEDRIVRFGFPIILQRWISRDLFFIVSNPFFATDVGVSEVLH